MLTVQAFPEEFPSWLFFGVEILWGYDTVKCLNMYICMDVYASRCNCVAVLYKTICLTWKPKQVWNTKKVTYRSHDSCPVRSNQRTNERSVFYVALKPMNDCVFMSSHWVRKSNEKSFQSCSKKGTQPETRRQILKCYLSLTGFFWVLGAHFYTVHALLDWVCFQVTFQCISLKTTFRYKFLWLKLFVSIRNCIK